MLYYRLLLGCISEAIFCLFFGTSFDSRVVDDWKVILSFLIPIEPQCSHLGMVLECHHIAFTHLINHYQLI